MPDTATWFGYRGMAPRAVLTAALVAAVGADLIAQTPPKCNGTGPLLYAINNMACELSRLTNSSRVSEEAACEEACCASATCNTWVSDGRYQCWTGSQACKGSFLSLKNSV